MIAKSYRPGKFFNASFDKASVYNERMSLRLRPEGGRRKPATWRWCRSPAWWRAASSATLAQGQGVQRGARFGIIRFGSRVDVYLPPGCTVLAAPGSLVRAGETILARFG